MNTDDTNLRRQINRILYNYWDPIGVCGCAPTDEYSDYVQHVLRLLKEGSANVQQISELLHNIADEYMLGMTTKAEVNTLAAKKLRALIMDNNSNQHVAVVDERAVRLQEEDNRSLIIPPVIQQQQPPQPSYLPSSSNVSAEDRLGYKISAILYNDWDPIGMHDHGLLPDEYDIYVPSILQLLQDGANEQQINEQLQKIASEQIGMNTKPQVNMLVAKKIRALITLENHQNEVVDERNSTTNSRLKRDCNSYSPPDMIRCSSSLLSNESAVDDAANENSNDARLRSQISEILFHDWDPIGCRDYGMPEDEYDSYVPVVLLLLKDHDANEQQISLKLQMIAKESIGVNTKPEVNMMVAKKLRALMTVENQVVDARSTNIRRMEYDRRSYSPPGHQADLSFLLRSANENAKNDGRLRSQISSILYNDWDPIGRYTGIGLPLDEYDSSVPSVFRLLKDGVDVQEIGLKLQKIAKESMGVNTKTEVNWMVAKKLRALMEEQAVDERTASRRMEYDSRSHSPPDIRSFSPLLSNESFNDVRIGNEINEILFHDWDPIGCHDCGMPGDEYKDYVPSVFRLLKDGGDVQHISKLLQKIAKDMMNIETKAEVDMLAAKKLRALMEKEVVINESKNDQFRATPVLCYGPYGPPPPPGPYGPTPSPTDDRRHLDVKINDILYYAWDPIGTMKSLGFVLPRYEYERYVPSVVRLMKQGGQVQEISEHLHKIAKEQMNFDTKAEVNKLVAMKLRALFETEYDYSSSSYASW